jgi:hypothetical protein
MQCPTCEGGGCEHCNDGRFEIPGCPNRYIGELVPAINMVDMFYKGLPPVAGGVLDQAAWFVSMAEMLTAEDGKQRAELYK